MMKKLMMIQIKLIILILTMLTIVIVIEIIKQQTSREILVKSS